MERIGRAREMAGAAWQVLLASRGLVGVLVVTSAAALVAAAAVFYVGAALMGPERGDGGAGWFVVVAAGAVGTWVASMGQAAVVAGAARRMDGEDPSVRSAFEPVRGRLGALFVWAVIATVVTKVLDVLRRRSGSAGSAASSGAKLGWRVVSFLALPVIVFEDAGPIEAVKRSASTLRSTWGENLTFNVGLSMLGLVLAAPVMAVLALAAAAGALPLPTAGFLALLLYVVVAMAVFSAVSAVLKTALYRWAHDLPVDPAFDDVELGTALGQDGSRSSTGEPQQPRDRAQR